MGYNTHLGPMRLGTVKEGSGKNTGDVIVTQTMTVGFAADGTVTTGPIIPAGSQIIDIHIDVTEIFNAAGDNTLKIGTTSDGAELVAATSVEALGRTSVATTGVFSAWMVGDSDITTYVTYDQTSTAATEGAARITFVYAMRNADGTSGNAP